MAMRFFDILKLTFKVLGFKYEQRKLTTNIYAVIKTKLGAVKGVKRNTIWGDSYYSFERIPFAQPPIDDLRFKAPVPVEPWDHELDCTTAADKPLQTHMFFRKFTGSEDCLYLSVFARDLDETKRRPVLVWIYGGGFQVGETSRDMYSPDFFMSKDVVLVSIAYRLGALGFLRLEDAAVNVPGNAGLKDQILGLKWVQDNITAFGGDPNNITLFGESAGGASTHIITISPQTKGLIHKAIVMSGSALCPWALRPQEDLGYRLALKLGYTGAQNDAHIFEFLQKAKGSEIVKASTTILRKDEKHHRHLFAFGPTIEPYETEHCVIASDPYEMLSKTWSNDIPIMFGGTSFEGLLFYPEVIRRPRTLEEVTDCSNLLPSDLPHDLEVQLRQEYALKLKQAFFGDEECNPQNIMKFLDLESYREFWHPIYRSVLARLRHARAPTYLYRFDYDSKVCNAIRMVLCGPEMRGVSHGDDLCYIFHCMLTQRAEPDMPEYNVMRTMIDIWTSFAEKSDPNCDSIAHVNVEPLKKDTTVKCLNISEKIDYVDLPELQKLEIWNSFYSQDKL